MTAPAHARAEPAPARITPRRATGKAAAACLAAVPLLPVLVIARAADYRIPHLQDYAGVILGLGATLCLLGCLAVTPVTWLARWPSAASWRRWLGLCVFITGAAGLAVAMAGLADRYPGGDGRGRHGPRMDRHADRRPAAAAGGNQQQREPADARQGMEDLAAPGSPGRRGR